MAELVVFSPGLKFEEIFRKDLRTTNGRLVEEIASPQVDRDENERRGVSLAHTPSRLTDSRRDRVVNMPALKAMVQSENWTEVEKGMGWLARQYSKEVRKNDLDVGNLFELGLAARCLAGYLVSKPKDAFPPDGIPNFAGDLVKIGKGIAVSAYRAAISRRPPAELDGVNLYQFADRNNLLIAGSTGRGCPAGPQLIADCFDTFRREMASTEETDSQLTSLITNWKQFREFSICYKMAEEELRRFGKVISGIPNRMAFVGSLRDIDVKIEELIGSEKEFLDHSTEIQTQTNLVLGRDGMVEHANLRTLDFFFGGSIESIVPDLQINALRALVARQQGITFIV